MDSLLEGIDGMLIQPASYGRTRRWLRPCALTREMEGSGARAEGSWFWHGGGRATSRLTGALPLRRPMPFVRT